jgi:membrane associated rhomboid family serine protease
MLADRNYSDGGYRAPLTMSAKLIIVLVAIFAIDCINQVYIGSFITRYLALSQAGISHLYLWQVVTFQFLHGGFFHVAVNCLMIWWFGKFVEQNSGRARMLTFFLLCGAVGGILQATLMFAFPQHFAAIVIGASAGTSGLFAIFAQLMGHQEIRLYCVLPVKAKTLLWAFVGIEGFFTLVPVRDGVAHAAHLGGLLMGIQIVKWGWHRDFSELPWERWWSNFQRKQTLIKKASGPTRSSRSRVEKKSVKSADAPPQKPADVKRRVDQILDKISEKGLNSLTEEERDFLERARKKM